MDKLWAPWRAKYIRLNHAKGCIFCIENKDRERFKTVPCLVIKKSKLSFAMLNIYPYNNGHIMVSPYRHVKDLKGLNDSEILDIMKLTIEVQGLLEKKLKPHGFNIGINVGRAGGAGYKNHLHIHIVPRWIGDTNFMPVVTNTKIVSQSLKELHKILTE